MQDFIIMHGQDFTQYNYIYARPTFNAMKKLVGFI